MSEDEEDLVESIIRVVICPKADQGMVQPVLPKILVTDHSEYDITVILPETEQKLREDEVEREHLDIIDEFMAEPTDLLPDSYINYVSSCRNIIGSGLNIQRKSHPIITISSEDFGLL